MKRCRPNTRVPGSARSYEWAVPDIQAARAMIRILRTSPWTYAESGVFAINTTKSFVEGVEIVPSGSRTELRWAPTEGAASVDVIRGDVSAVREGVNTVKLGRCRAWRALYRRRASPSTEPTRPRARAGSSSSGDCQP